MNQKKNLTDLSKCLFSYGINTWNHNSENNKFSVTLIDTKTLGKSKTYYSKTTGKDYLTVVLDPESNMNAAIKDIKDFVSEKRNKLNNAAYLLLDLEQYRYRESRKSYQNSEEGSSIQDIISKAGFIVDEDWISWNKHIPIGVIIYKYKYFMVDPAELEKLNYGVDSFKIRNCRYFNSIVICEGKHPNINPDTKQLCNVGSLNILGNTVGLDILFKIKGALSYINMDSMYKSSVHLPILKKFTK